VTERLPPPNDVAAERALLDALLDDPDQIDAVEAELQPSDMWDNTHKDLLAALYSCRASSEPCDSTTVCRQIMATAGPSRAQDAVRAIHGFAGTSPFGADVLGHSRAILTASRNRKLLAALEQAAGKARLNQGDEARAAVEEISRTQVCDSRVLTVREILTSAGERANRSADTVEKWTTLHHDLDQMIGGLRCKFSYVIGAFTNVGKSSWLIGVADEMLVRKTGVLIVSVEDDESIYGDRLLARRALVSADHIRDNTLTPEESKSIDRVIQSAEDAPVYLNATGKPVEWILPRIKTLVTRHGLKCVMIDYIQKVRRERPMADQRLSIKATFDELSDLGKNLGCVTIIASQLTKNRENAVPDEYSLRECQDMANGADYILIGYRPEKETTRNDGEIVPAGSTVFKVAKAKLGRKGQVVMQWNTLSACFDTVLKPKFATERDRACERAVESLGFAADNDDDSDMFKDW
jgi:replicative DNA helicase